MHFSVNPAQIPNHGCQGKALATAVETGLRAVNLHNLRGKPVGKFSGGMKRRLSVAISFMGNPSVVYLDEPSTVRGHSNGSYLI